MKIRTNSWHYKLYSLTFDRFYSNPSRTNFCTYFWRTVLGLLLAIVFGAFGAFVLGMLGLGFYQYTAIALQVLGGILAVAGVIFLCFRARERALDRKYAAMAMPGYQEPAPSLLRLYLKAKKDKACFLVEFVDAP